MCVEPKALTWLLSLMHYSRMQAAPHPPVAVALVVNSPGGSPVQSRLIGQYIDSLAAKTKIPTLAFAEDVAASGGYW